MRTFIIIGLSLTLWAASLAWGLWYGARPTTPSYTPIYFTREVCGYET